MLISGIVVSSTVMGVSPPLLASSFRVRWSLSEPDGDRIRLGGRRAARLAEAEPHRFPRESPPCGLASVPTCPVFSSKTRSDMLILGRMRRHVMGQVAHIALGRLVEFCERAISRLDKPPRRLRIEALSRVRPHSHRDREHACN